VAGIPGWILTAAGVDLVVEPYIGHAAHGPVYGPATRVRVVLDEARRLVRTDAGEETVSSATAYAPLGVEVPVGSRVTLPSGRTSTVLAVHRRDGGALPVPSHVEVVLT